MAELNIQFYRQLIFDVDNASTSNEKQTASDALIQYLGSLLDETAIVEEKIRSAALTLDDLRMITSLKQLRDRILEDS